MGVASLIPVTIRQVRPKAYPLKHHKTCAEITRKDVSYDESLKLPPGEGLQHRLDAGIAFEDEVEDLFTAAAEGTDWTFVKIVNDRTDAGKRKAEADTLAAMASGADVIWNGRLLAPDTYTDDITVEGPNGDDVIVTIHGGVGEPDVMVLSNRADVDAGIDTPRYWGVDVKWHRTFEGSTQPKDWPVSQFADPFFENAADLSHEGYPKLADALQLVHYQMLLDAHGFSDPRRVGGVIGKELQILWFGLDDKYWLHALGQSKRSRTSAASIYDYLTEQYVGAVAHETLRDDNDMPASRPEWKTDCKECGWRDVCLDELVEANHISLLPGISPTRLGPHYDAGVDEISQLAHVNVPAALAIDAGVDLADIVHDLKVENVSRDVTVGRHLRGSRSAAKLRKAGFRTVGDILDVDDVTLRYAGSKVHNLAAAVDQARAWQTGKVYLGRGVDHVAVPQMVVTVHNDIEDLGGDHCYMIGNVVTITRRGYSTTEYKCFVEWDGDDAAEEKVFADFWAWMTGLRSWVRDRKYGGFVMYHYTDHETRFYRHLADKHAGKPGIPTVDEVEAFLSSKDWIDLYKVVKDALVWPTKDHTVKTLAQAVGFTWRDDNPSGDASTSWAKTAMFDENEDVREEMRERILAYNEDDCAATDAIVTWLRRKTTHARRPGMSLPQISTLDKRFGPTSRSRKARNGPRNRRPAS